MISKAKEMVQQLYVYAIFSNLLLFENMHGYVWKFDKVLLITIIDQWKEGYKLTGCR